MSSVEPAVHRPPLYVDLDGTLVATDTLWESLLGIVRERPSSLLAIPGWLAGGRASFKAHVAERATVRAELLPYREAVLAHIERARGAGRRCVLVTASDASIAEAVAAHLGVFDAVLASDGQRNLKGEEKLRAILDDAPAGGFEYLGDSNVDVPIWKGAGRATLVAPAPGVAAAVARLGIPAETLVERSSPLRAALRAIRPRQWAKNLLLFVPVFLAHTAMDEPGRVLAAGIAFLTFCACASATYLLNDLLDIDADRRHATKRLRPFAAGTLSVPAGLAWFAALLGGGLATSLALLPLACTGMLAAYIVLTTVYSLTLKERLFVDVLTLAGLYTHRVLAGGVAADVPISPWLLAFSMFIFLSLALVKRYVELLSARRDQRSSLARRGYKVDDVGLVESMGMTSGYLAVLVIGLYVSSDDVTRLYAAPKLLWLTCPILLYWISRIWFLARRGELSADPVLFAVGDRTSYVCGALIVAVGFMATLFGSAGAVGT